jgi:hypothetical protein
VADGSGLSAACGLSKDVAMNTIARSFIAAVLAAGVLAPRAVAADSVVKVHASNAAGFERFLPALPVDIPWLAADRRAPQKHAVLGPDAPSLSTWMLIPKPVAAWPLPVQAAGPASTFAGM